MAGIPANRVVAVVADLDTGLKQIGSGYLLDAGQVLTAHHCAYDKVTGRTARALRVVRASDGAFAPAVVSAVSPDLDVALLRVQDPPWDGEPPLDRVVFGRLDRDLSRRLDDCEAVGFPLWQCSEIGDHRDIAELHGRIYAMEGRESQRLVMREPVLSGVGWAQAKASGQSAWSGLSGAAVFHEGLLLGVVIEHHLRQGPSAVQIRPVDALVSAADPESARLARALSLGVPDAFREVQPGAMDMAVDAYLRFHIARCSHIDPSGLPQASDSPGMMLPLTDVYSAARLGLEGSDEVAADHALTELGRYRGTFQDEVGDDLLAFESPPPGGGESFAWLVRDRRWLVVLGDPGAGKTTLLKWLTLKNAQALHAGRENVEVKGEHVGLPEHESVTLGPARLPVLVRVADYVDHLAKCKAEKKALPGLHEFLGRHKLDDEALPGDEAGNTGLIRRYLQAGQALILLDGLDEITDASMRDLVARRIELFIGEHVRDPGDPNAFAPDANSDTWWKAVASQPVAVGGNQVVVTSRRAGYKEARLRGQVTTTAILPLQESAIRRFADDWCVASERHRAMGTAIPDTDIEATASATAKALADEILADPQITALAANPLLLTMLAFVRGQGPLPTHRVKLYEMATNVLARRRQAAGWSAGEAVAILGPFALWLQERSDRGSAPEGILREYVRSSLSRIREGVTDADLDEFVRLAREQAGLLVETGAGRYGFMHPTFREYVAAVEIARSPEAVKTYVTRFLHIPRWTETLRMCAAITSTKHPDSADDMLTLILSRGSPLEDVLHRDLLFAASCLHEMQNVTSRLTAEVVERLLNTAAWAGRYRFGKLQERVTDALADLSVSFPRVTLPRLYRALRAVDDTARVVTQVAYRQQRPTIELLDALDAACRSPYRDPSVMGTRAAVADQLLLRGLLDDDSYRPIRDLLEQHTDALARLDNSWPAAGRLLRSKAGWCSPDLSEACHWLLARVDISQNEAGLRAAFVTELLARAEASGSDFLTLWSAARALDRVTADRWIIDAYATGTGDREWMARCLSLIPEAFPAARFALEEWFDALPLPARGMLLKHQAERTKPSPLVPVAWRYSAEAGDVSTAAREFLCRQSATTGGVPGSPTAFEALSAMLKADDPHSVLLARALLSRLLKSESLTFGYLRRMTGEDNPHLCRMQAAILLTSLGLRVPVGDYDLVAQAIADQDGPLRAAAIAAVNAERACPSVDEAVLQRSWHHFAERLASGDGPGAAAHMSFGSSITHTDAAHIIHLLAVAGEWDMCGQLTESAVGDLVERANELSADDLGSALNVCRSNARSSQSTGADVASVARICQELEQGESQLEAARLLGEEAILTGPWTEAGRTVNYLVESGNIEAAAALVHAAAWQLRLDTARSVPLTVASLMAARDALSAGANTEAEARMTRAVALLVECAANPSGPDITALRQISGVAEAAAALIDALATQVSWSYPPPPHGMQARLASFAIRVASRDRGMTAVLREAARVLAAADNSDWERRRAALYVTDTVAAAYPALFVETAPSALREQVLAVANDAQSHSIRLLSVNVMAHFRPLDSDALGVIARACRDHRHVSASTVLRCQSMIVESDSDIGEIITMTGSEHQPTIMAGAVLLSSLARSPYVSANQRELIEATLAKSVLTPNPAMDVVGVHDGRSLRSWLHDLLMDMAWWERQASPTPTAGWWAAASGAPRSRADPAQDEASSAAQALKRTILELPVELSRQAPDPRPFELKSGDPMPSWTDLGLGDLHADQLFHLARSMAKVLEHRVGETLAREMTAAQLAEFKPFTHSGRGYDNARAQTWINANLPAYRVVVIQQVESLLDEVLRTRKEIRQALTERFNSQAAERSQVGNLRKLIQDLPLTPGTMPSTAPPFTMKVISNMSSWQELGYGDLPGLWLFHLAKSTMSALEWRVGMDLIKAMEGGQIDEFETSFNDVISQIDQFRAESQPDQPWTPLGANSKAQSEALRWLESNFPNYQWLVRANAESLLRDLQHSELEIRRALSQRFQRDGRPAEGGERAEAIAHLRRVLAAKAAHYGEMSERLLPTLAALAEALPTDGDPSAALHVLEQAAAISEHLWGPRDLRMAVPWRKLACALNACDRGLEAIAVLQKLIELHDHYGAETAEVTNDLRNLAAILKREDQPEQAERYRELAQDIDGRHRADQRESSHPEEPLDLLQSLKGWGLFVRAAGFRG